MSCNHLSMVYIIEFMKMNATLVSALTSHDSIDISC